MDLNCRVKSKHGILSLVAENPVFINDLQQEAQLLYQQILNQQDSQNVPSLPVQKIYSQSGAWYCSLKNNIVISLLVTSSYPMPSAMRLLKQIEELLKRQIQSGKYEFQPIEPNLRQLLTQYDRDPFTDDKIEITCKSVDSIQGLNGGKYKEEQLHVIHHKSAEVSQMANQFQKGATAVNTKQNWAAYLAIGIFGALLIGIIIYIFL
ncbi:unnamed protein product (macronuclear) [Paramecium tetraurelia]|uniref:V-SNARE coiled-coil homology domain-containing protein n=1 Tax=Paramecium tetraurelia TaxID=5888 RepID=A0DZT7_PARTE|nr:uncharacterized protein GSPATT00021722001 [Paramecium tetraurelia]CAK88554.1 unnamed protein product [Paramecium tetraurelia]|eukprot:XP_001455951.1 hypothetical protein (macronuclear) [Paramecium tetraurelia strain d4-2]